MQIEFKLVDNTVYYKLSNEWVEFNRNAEYKDEFSDWACSDRAILRKLSEDDLSFACPI